MTTGYPRAFSHIGISVPDLERAVEFYNGVMSWYLIMPPTEIVASPAASEPPTNTANTRGRVARLAPPRFRLVPKLLRVWERTCLGNSVSRILWNVMRSRYHPREPEGRDFVTLMGVLSLNHQGHEGYVKDQQPKATVVAQFQ